MDYDRIQEILPHRYPFLFIDRVVEVVPGERLRAIKNVTVNEPFFTGHFPDRPVMPGVLICEAMAQAAALLAHATSEFSKEENDIYLMGLDKVRFRRVVVPGDRLEIEVTMVRRKSAIWKQRATAAVDGERAAECELLATIKKKDA